MDVKILDKNKNVLMKRTEVVCEIEHEGEPTPKRDEVRKNVAGQLGANEKFVVIKSIDSVYGGGSKAVLHIYSSEKDMMSHEKRHLLIRSGIIKSEKAEEKPEEKPEERKPQKPEEVEENGKEEKGTEDKGEEDKEEETD